MQDGAARLGAGDDAREGAEGGAVVQEREDDRLAEEGGELGMAGVRGGDADVEPGEPRRFFHRVKGDHPERVGPPGEANFEG